MKIALIETHWKSPDNHPNRTSAVDYFRSLSPIKYAAQQMGWQVDTFRGLGENPSVKDYAKFKEYDFIWLSYLDNSIALKYLIDVDVPYSVDIDDDLINLEPTNPVRLVYKPGSLVLNTLIWTIKHVPHLTTSTEHLKKVYKQIREIPITPINNAVNLSEYPLQEKTKHKSITIGYMGGITHYADLFYSPFWGALCYLMAKYDITFSVFGMAQDLRYKDLPNIEYTSGTSDYYDYHKTFLEWSKKIDIAVAPLHESYFNLSKSNIKAQEYATQKLPIVASNWKPYSDFNGKTKALTLCESHKEWVDALEALIVSKQLREESGQRAFNRVKELSLERNWKKWANYIETIVNNRKKSPKQAASKPISLVLFRCLLFGGNTGSELYMYDLAKEYIKRGIRVCVQADHYSNDYLEEAKRIGIEFELTETPDIIHAQQVKPTESVLSYGVPVVQTVHSEVIPVHEFPVTHENVKAYIAVRPSIEEFVSQHTNKPITTIFNGVDTSLFFKGGKGEGTLFVGKDDYLRHEVIKKLKQKNATIVSGVSQEQIAKLTRECAMTASILLGRTTIEGWHCGKPGLVFEVDEHGKVLSQRLLEPPADLTPYTIEYMADRTLEVYKKCL